MMISTSSLQAFNSTFNSVTGPQFNLGDNATVTINHPPQPVTEYDPPKRINDAPIDLLTANFTGRRKDIDFLLQAFGTQTGSSEHDLPTRCAVHGMPGVGKTKLILQFAQTAFVRHLYSHVFWTSATTTDKLIEGMTKILDLVGHPEPTRSSQNAKLTAARLWLEDSQRMGGIRWLLVLDNVDRHMLEFLRENLPRRNGTGSILFTTRTADVAAALINVTGGPHFNLELRVPDLAETTLLLFSSAGIDTGNVTPAQQSQAEELALAFGCLPLAVVQAASYMRQTATALDDMLQLSKSERKIVVIQWENDLTTYQQKSVISTFKTLLDQLEKVSPETFDLLAVLSFLDAENIPLAMLTDGAQASSLLVDEPLPEKSHRMFSRFTKWMPRHRTQNTVRNTTTSTHPLPELRQVVSLILSPTLFPNALCKLQSLSLVERWSRDGKSSLRIHDLVHFMTQEHAKRRSTYQVWLQSSTSLVCSAWNDIDQESPQKWPECEKFVPHVRSLSKAWTGVPGVNLVLVAAEVHLAQYLRSRGRYDDAEKICERCVEMFQRELGDEHQGTLIAADTLARIYHNQGRRADAEEAYKRILVVWEKVLGANHRDTLRTMNNLAGICRRQGRHEKAEELFKQVLAVYTTSLGPDHRDTLTTMNNLALVYDSQNDSQKRYDKAEELFKHVLSRQETTLGPDHIDTFITANNLACVYQSQSKYSDAEELFKHVLVGLEKQLGPNHPDTLITATSLGFLYRQQARNDEAEQFLLRALTGRKQQLGVSHPGTLSCAEALVALYLSQGRSGEADALLGGWTVLPLSCFLLLLGSAAVY